jgi:hypothetical protein
MQFRTIQSSTDSRLAYRLPIGAFFLLLAQIPTTYDAVYKCTARELPQPLTSTRANYFGFSSLTHKSPPTKTQNRVTALTQTAS